MAAMTTVLKLQARNGHKTTYTVPADHTALKPVLVLQDRKVPVGNQRMMEDSVTCLRATTDENGVILDSKVSTLIRLRRDKHSAAADITAQIALVRDFVASDEFAALWNAQDNISD